MFKIYCAGPLFNPIERKEMLAISNTLKDAGFSVFLPHEDGLEFARLFPTFLERGFQQNDAQKILNHAIFSLDVYEVIDADGLVLNMNGRVPDEGAMVEAGIAWANNKPIVIFNSDDRSLVQGVCNPLAMGLSNFEVISEYQQIPVKFTDLFSQSGEKIIRNEDFPFEETKNKGKAISEYISNQKNQNEIAELLINLFGEDLCTKGQRRSCVDHNMQQ